MSFRYSYWHKIVPLLLVSFCDEVTSVSSLAVRLWTEAGAQWLEENKMNDKRLKEELDFLTSEPEHYPDWVERPGLGCRTLAARIQHQVYPSVNNDLKDWQRETRVKAVQLMYVMLYHSEQDIVMHTEKVMSSLVMAGRDEEEKVREMARKCSVILGYILPGLVKILLAVESLTREPSLVESLRGWEERLGGEEAELYLLAGLPSLLAEYLLSSPCSPQLEIFRRILSLSQSGAVTGHFPRTMLAILTNLCSGGDPNTRLQSFIILSRLLLNLQDTLDSQGAFSPCIVGVGVD